MDIRSPPITHKPTESRFVTVIDGSESDVRYIEDSDSLNIVSTSVNPLHRGRGVAAKLNDAAFAYANAKGLRIVATCSYTAAYLTRLNQG